MKAFAVLQLTLAFPSALACTVALDVMGHTAITQRQIDARPAGVQNSLYLGSSVDGCHVTVPFVNTDSTLPASFPDKGPPKVRIDVNGYNYVTAGASLDIGSIGTTIGINRWSGVGIGEFRQVFNPDPARSGFKYLSSPGSSGKLYKGYWHTATITFKDLSNRPLIQSTVDVLVYNQAFMCTGPLDMSGNCPHDGTVDDLRGMYIGIGYGRGYVNGNRISPNKNPFLKITRLWRDSSLGCPCNYRNGMLVSPSNPLKIILVKTYTKRVYTKGYIIRKTGITWGLSNGNAFKWQRLNRDPGADEQYGWAMAPMSLTVNSRPPIAGDFLPDTGITYSYIRSPDVPSSGQIPPTASYRLQLPGIGGSSAMGSVVYNRLLSGIGDIMPSSYNIARDGGRVFINPGSHFFNCFDTAYDADYGFYESELRAPAILHVAGHRVSNYLAALIWLHRGTSSV
ncbi:hypothetical protein TWF718_002975 [Orbilia javanica]|uniref:Peptidase A2 domain-containing protein n=1 Tax=Orbilia javanica TaxID=47235 RepID=A0AAN8MLM6_9PEZI